MLPQGTSQSDGDYFTALTAQINAIDACGELQALVNEAMASIQAEVSGIEAQLLALGPIKLLLELPTDLGSLISWVRNFVNSVIKPIIGPITIYIAQLETLITEIAALTQAIENAALRLENCSITVPVISITIPTP